MPASLLNGSNEVVTLLLSNVESAHIKTFSNSDMVVTNEDVVFRSSHSDRAAKCNTTTSRINPKAKVHRKHLKGIF